MKSFLQMKDFILNNKWYYFLGIIFLVITNLLQLVIPRLLGQFTDQISEGLLEYSDLFYYIGLIIVLALFIALFRYLWRVFIFGTARRLEFSLRNRLFTHLQKLSANFYHQHKVGDLMAHATNDINAVRMALGPGFILIIDTLVLTMATIGIMFRTIDPRLTVFALLPLPFLALVVVLFGRKIHRRFKMVQEAFSQLTDRVQENFSGIRVVKSFVQEDQEIDNFSEVNQQHVDKNMHLIKIYGLFYPLIFFISALSFMIVLGYGGLQVIYGHISLGDFVAFNSYLGLLTWPMMAIGWVINLLQRGAASMERINKLLDEEPEITEDPHPLPLDHLKGEIEFRDLTFSYQEEEEPVLKNINLKIQAGKTLAIVGRTGSGKTTLVNLLLRIYEPGENEILIDGHDIRRLPFKTLRESIGCVPQDNFLFSRSIEENIAFGRNQFQAEEVKRVSKIAQVHDNIVDFTEGYETVLGERGVTLSGGQKQRVSIARALLKEPQILILDDSLSAVDTQTEEEILRDLKPFMQQRTTIIISHRISTIKDADRIVVLHQGEIIERGKHHELLEKEGLYYSLHQKQLLEEKIARSS